MRIVDFTTPVANLQEAHEKLEYAFRNLRDVWNDSTAQAFEDNHMEPIRPRVKMTLDAVNRLTLVINQAQRECGDKRPEY